MKKKIAVKVFEQEQYDGEWPPENAISAIAWLQEKVDSIPAAFRADAKIEIEGVTSYDSGYAKITISYTRPETDEEESARENAENFCAEQQRQRELKQLAELQAKYGKHDG